jgi:hypothetical protein
MEGGCLCGRMNAHLLRNSLKLAVAIWVKAALAEPFNCIALPGSLCWPW